MLTPVLLGSSMANCIRVVVLPLLHTYYLHLHLNINGKVRACFDGNKGHFPTTHYILNNSYSVQFYLQKFNKNKFWTAIQYLLLIKNIFENVHRCELLCTFDGVNQNVNLFYKGSVIILIFSGMCLFGGARTLRTG